MPKTTNLGRMSTGTSFSFFLLGISFVLFKYKTFVLGLVSTVQIISISSLLGYVIGYKTMGLD